MQFVLGIVLKIVWWVLPKLLGNIVDRLGDILGMVEALNGDIADKAQRRQEAIARIQAQIPVSEGVARWVLECAVILDRLGLTANDFKIMENVITDFELDKLSVADARKIVIDKFAELCPDMPERVGRLVFELVWAKVTQ